MAVLTWLGAAAPGREHASPATNLTMLRLGAALLVVTLLVSYLRNQWKRKSPPPGPSGLPVLGNALQLGEFPWLNFTAWKDKYGPIMYLDGAGQPIVVINSLKVPVDLLDRKAGVTSDRPHIIVPDMMTGGLFTPFVGYNNI